MSAADKQIRTGSGPGIRGAFNAVAAGALVLDARGFPSEDAWIESPNRVALSEWMPPTESPSFAGLPTPDLLGPVWVLVAPDVFDALASDAGASDPAARVLAPIKGAPSKPFAAQLADLISSGSAAAALEPATAAAAAHALAYLAETYTVPGHRTLSVYVADANALVEAYPPLLASSTLARTLPVFPAHTTTSIMHASKFIADQPAILDAFHCAYILNCAVECSPVPEVAASREILHIPLVDDLEQVLDDDALAAAVAFIAKATPDARVLVHCAQGISRSTALIIAYLCETGAAANYDDAYDTVVAARPIARPNPGFAAQLKDRYT